MNLQKLIFTKNDCYKAGKKITPKGVMVHSTGANNPYLKRYVGPDDGKLGKNTYNNHWNQPMDRSVCVHAFIGKLNDGSIATYQTLPWDHRGWHGGGDSNNTHISFEICEDGLTNKDYFNAVYKEAVELTAMLCKEYKLDPLKDGVVICHSEGYKRGIASNHGDVMHWFPKHGKNMNTFRADVKAQLATLTESPSKPEPTTVTTYKLVVDVPVYTTAADAKDRVNSKSVYKAGTYYIYTKYPNGLNGMLNITKDTSGASAGGWINPADNIKQEVAETPQLYRVRKSWADTKSQKGAFSSLDNAKACCQEAGAGYKVYDNTGKEVYAYVAPKPVEPEIIPDTPKEEPKCVWELDYEDKHVIVASGGSASLDLDDTECTRAIVAIKKNNPAFDENIAKAFFTLAPKYAIDPVRAISQSILETGWFKFASSSVKASQNNFCGLGATGGGVAGAAFDTIEDGVRAQLQHLYAYGCKDALPVDETTIVDPRFKYVTRGIAKYWEQLAGRWAVPGFDGNDPEEAMKNGTTYGQKIDKLYEQLKATKITQEDISKYFPVFEEEPEEQPQDTPNETVPDVPAPDLNDVIPTPPTNDVPPEDDVEPDNGVDEEHVEEEDSVEPKVESIVDIIIRVLKRLAEIFIQSFKK